MQKVCRDLLIYIGSYLNARELMIICETAKILTPMVDWRECAKHAKPRIVSIHTALQNWQCPDAIRKRWCLTLYIVSAEDFRCSICLEADEESVYDFHIYEKKTKIYFPVCADCDPNHSDEAPDVTSTVWIGRPKHKRQKITYLEGLPYIWFKGNSRLWLVEDMFDILEDVM